MKTHESMIKKKEFVELRGIHEMSLDLCCQKLNVSKTTLIAWERQLVGSINGLKQANLSFLVDSYKLSLQERIKRLHTISERLMTEIEKRDLSIIPPYKLIHLFLDITKVTNSFLLENKVEEPSFTESYI